jgi:DNA repair ATPase RecN
MKAILLFLYIVTYPIFSDTEMILSDLENTLNHLDKVLNEPEIDPKKLSVLSKRIKNIKRNIRTISNTKQVEHSYSNLIDVFVSTMNEKTPQLESNQINPNEYNRLYKKLLKKLIIQKGRPFANKYMDDVSNLIYRHNVRLEDQIRFLIRLDEKWK